MPTEISPGVQAETVGDLLSPPPMGHNRTRFEILSGDLDDLIMEAKNWLDGEAIQNDAQAGEIGKLRDAIRTKVKELDEERKVEAKPHDDAKKAIQDRYNKLIKDGTGLGPLAMKTCNDVLAPYLRKKDDEQRAAALAAQKAAQEAAYAAQQAAIQAAAATDLEQRQSAEDMLKNAKSLLIEANRADKAKPQVGGGSRNIGLKSVWRGEVTDYSAALSHYRTTQPEALRNWIDEQVAKDVRSGSRVIPGVKIHEDKVPV